MDRLYHPGIAAYAREHWRITLIIAVLALIALLAEGVHRRIMVSRLLETEADAVQLAPSLRAFAEAEARPLYAKLCLDCHGARLRGDRSLGVPDLRGGDWLYGSGRVSEIERVILYGIRSGNGKGWNLADMPAYGTSSPYRRSAIPPLSPGDIRDTVEYLHLLEHKPADAAAAQRGREIYAGRGACYDCHAPDGRGDTSIGAPNLTHDLWLYGDGSRQSLFDSIARGHAGSCPAWARRLSAWEVRALAVYVHGAASDREGP